MKNKDIYILVAVVVLLFGGIHFIIKPFIHKRGAVTIVTRVLDNWSDKNQLVAIDQWDNPKEYPHIYLVSSYKIIDKDFYKENRQHYGKITVEIDFKPGQILPSGERWVFILRDTSLGWKIDEFYSLDSPNILSPRI